MDCESAEFLRVSNLSLVLFVCCVVLPPILSGFYIRRAHQQGRLRDDSIRLSLGFLFAGYVDITVDTTPVSNDNSTSEASEPTAPKRVFPWWESVS